MSTRRTLRSWAHPDEGPVSDAHTPPVRVHCLDCGAELDSRGRGTRLGERRHCAPCLAVTRERVRADMAQREHLGIVGWGLDDRPLSDPRSSRRPGRPRKEAA